jgi:threonine/homoserine/homoserine lactone efflux protein
MRAVLLGFLCGFFGSVPVAGPIAALVLVHALAGQGRRALAVASGAAVAEAGWALLAFWGLSTLLRDHQAWQVLARGLAAMVLIALGIVLLRVRGEQPVVAVRKASGRDVFAGFLLTAANPTLLVTWSAASTTLLGAGWLAPDVRQAPWLATGVLVGIVAWFMVLVRLVTHGRERISPLAMRRILRGTGVLLLGVGLWTAGQVVRG